MALIGPAYAVFYVETGKLFGVVEECPAHSLPRWLDCVECPDYTSHHVWDQDGRRFYLPAKLRERFYSKLTKGEAMNRVIRQNWKFKTIDLPVRYNIGAPQQIAGLYADAKEESKKGDPYSKGKVKEMCALMNCLSHGLRARNNEENFVKEVEEIFGEMPDNVE